MTGHYDVREEKKEGRVVHAIKKVWTQVLCSWLIEEDFPWIHESLQNWKKRLVSICKERKKNNFREKK